MELKKRLPTDATTESHAELPEIKARADIEMEKSKEKRAEKEVQS